MRPRRDCKLGLCTGILGFVNPEDAHAKPNTNDEHLQMLVWSEGGDVILSLCLWQMAAATGLLLE